MSKKFWMLGTALLALAGCGETAEESAPPTNSPTAAAPASVGTPGAPMAAPATAAQSAAYVAKAGAGDLWEIESSKALLAKSDNSEVRKFAQMMIDQHGQSTAKTKAAAAAAKVDVAAPQLDPAQQTMLDEIKQADAGAIDAIYLRHQRAAHDAALALHRAYSEDGDTESLKTAAREIVTVVEMHRSRLDKLGSQT